MDKKGFTLMEILVAALIMALVMTGIVNVFVSAKRYILHSQWRMTATQLGKHFLDPLALQVRQDQWGNNCLTNSSKCTAQSATINTIQFNATYNTSDVSVAPAMRKAKVTINWTEPTF